MLESAVKILGFGLSGLGFLLMYLAYRLLDKQGQKDSPSELIIKSINRYIAVCLAMTIVVGSFTFITNFYRQEKIEQQALALKDKTDVINNYVSAQRVKSLSDSIGKLANNGKVEVAKKLANEQKGAFDTLNKTLSFAADVDANMLVKSQKFIIDYPVLFENAKSTAARDSLFAKYKMANNKVVKASLTNATLSLK